MSLENEKRVRESLRLKCNSLRNDNKNITLNFLCAGMMQTQHQAMQHKYFSASLEETLTAVTFLTDRDL